MHIKFIAFQASFIVLEYTFQRIYELQLKLTIVFLKWGIYHWAKQTSLFSWESKVWFIQKPGAILLDENEKLQTNL